MSGIMRNHYFLSTYRTQPISSILTPLSLASCSAIIFAFRCFANSVIPWLSLASLPPPFFKYGCFIYYRHILTQHSTYNPNLQRWNQVVERNYTIFTYKYYSLFRIQIYPIFTYKYYLPISNPNITPFFESKYTPNSHTNIPQIHMQIFLPISNTNILL